MVFQLGMDMLRICFNIYQQKKPAKVFANYRDKKLQEINFRCLVSEDCVFMSKKVIFVAYVDDTLDWWSYKGSNQYWIENWGLKISCRLCGVYIERNNDGKILLLQPMLIQSILKKVGLGPRMMLKPVPTSSQKLLQPYLSSKVFKNCFHYWSLIGKLNYLAMLTPPDIQVVVHSCARYSTCPKQKHGEEFNTTPDI